MSRSHLTWQTHRPTEGFYTSEVQSPHSLPVRTFLPTGYEPNYPYPLLVFFHNQGGCEEQALRLAPRVSRRNYVCISLRGPHPVGLRSNGQIGYGWGPDGPCDPATEEYVLRAVEQTRRSYHVHSERIYLAGFCEGATLAYRLALSFPEKFAGVIGLNGTLPRHSPPLFRPNAMRHLRAFVGHGIANALVPMALARRDARLLYTAGVSVEVHTYPTTHRLHPQMLRDVDRWIMQALEAEWE